MLTDTLAMITSISQSVGDFFSWARLRAGEAVDSLRFSRRNTQVNQGDDRYNNVVVLDSRRRAIPSRQIMPIVARNAGDFRLTALVPEDDSFSLEVGDGAAVRALRIRPRVFPVHVTAQRLAHINENIALLSESLPTVGFGLGLISATAMPKILQKLYSIVADLVDVAQWGQQNESFEQLMSGKFKTLLDRVMLLVKGVGKNQDQTANMQLSVGLQILSKYLNHLREHCSDNVFAEWVGPHLRTLSATQNRMKFRVVVD